MHFESRAFFFVMFLTIFALTAGCSSLPVPGPSTADSHDKIDVGFSSTPASSTHVTYGFDRFLSKVSSPQSADVRNLSVNATPDRHFLYIRGVQMDESGNAESWMAVVREGNITSMIFYDKFGERISGTGTNDNLPVIPMDRILTPAQLFNQNRNIVFNKPRDVGPGPMTLELTDRSYTLTIPARNTTRILKFDALTGALIASNE